MPNKTKSKHSSTPLGKFLQETMQERNLSLRTVAAGAGISHAYLSRIVSGEKSPEAGVCNAIADYLNIPRVTIYKLVGWLDLDEDQAFVVQFQEYAKKHPELASFVKMVMSIEDEGQRNAMLRLIRAGLAK